MAGKLGILAGAGALPLILIEACRAQHRPFFVLGFEGFCDPASLAGVPHDFVRLAAGGAALRLFRANDVEEIVFVGGVRRPSLWQLRPDARAARFFAKIGFRALTDFGDDALFRAIVTEVESEGFRIVGADSILADLLAPVGLIGRVAPAAADEADIRLGFDAARGHGAKDLGQAVVVRGGVVVDHEDVAGTDALIRRCGAAGKGRGAILVKTAKPGQERRVDLPGIGPNTVAEAAEAGLKGIAIEAGACFVLEREAVIGAADRAGLFIIGVATS